MTNETAEKTQKMGRKLTMWITFPIAILILLFIFWPLGLLIGAVWLYLLVKRRR